jgi:UDP-N-acetylmuramoyl-tripeptide--D-alanyl-D-alanine ligase
LTGSNGKTTTKEMIAACLETAFPILKTKENLNNLIGVPLTLLSLTPNERVAVIEMGMNVPGEIRRLTEIAEPDVGLITNIQSVHLEGMGSLERLQEEKGELFRRMRRDGTILVNQDDPRIVDLAKDYPGQKITYGINHPADIMAKEIHLHPEGGLSFTLILEGEVLEIHLPLLGKHFVPDALSAIAVASLFGLETPQVKEALEAFQPFPMRMEMLRLDGGKTLIINDAYNANPSSMQVALETLAEIKGEGRSIAVLGDMLELGDLTREAHEQIGQRVSTLSIDFLFVLGTEAPVVIESAVRHGFPMERTRVVESHSEAVALLRQMMQSGDRILVKGSRKMKMEEIVKSLSEGRT